MIEELLRKATGLSEKSSDSMPEPAIVPLYSHRIRFADHRLSSEKAVRKLSQASAAIRS
jgi:hypothetical protein